MPAPHEKIRQDAVSKLTEPARTIVAYQFSAAPRLEAHYYDYISKDPFYSEIHKRWVLSQSPLPPLPEEDELSRLREDILGIRGIAEPEKVALNDPLFAFFLDMLSPFLNRLVAQALAYYELPAKTNGKMLAAIQHAAYGALLICDPDHIKKRGYPDFSTAFGDAFRVFFSQEIGADKYPPLPTDDTAFMQAVEQEWQRLLPYSDYLYGFSVVPKISPEEMLRYLKLPFAKKGYQRLLRENTYRQINNYIVALATFKPVPDFRLKTYFRNELCALYVPLAENIAKRESKRKSQNFSLEQLKDIVMDEIPKVAAAFDYFYATNKNFERGKISPFGAKIFPLNDSYLAKLGHLASGDEFPFTDYLQKSLTKRMRQFFAVNLPPSAISADDELPRKDDDGDDPDTILDTIAADDDMQIDRSQQIPGYDATDENKNKIGWKRDTFARIIGKSRDTLKRWDKEGLLKPLRYPIYSYLRKQDVPYRVYTREDIPKAKEIAIRKNKQMKHQL